MSLNLLSASLLSQVFVVGLGGDFSTIQAGIDAAAPGDVLRVLPGQYASFTVSAKGITILGAEGATFVDANAATGGSVTLIEQVPNGQQVLLRDLSFVGQKGVLLSGNPGQIYLEQCSIELDSDVLTPGGSHCADVALTVADCTSLAMVDCKVLGAPAPTPLPQQDPECSAGGSALISNSSAFLWNSEFRSAKGKSGPFSAEPGKNGLSVVASTVVAQNSRFEGGAGGNQNLQSPLFGTYGKDGGNGIDLTNSALTDYGSEFVPGTAGATIGIFPSPGEALAVLSNSTASLVPREATQFDISSWVSAGQSIALDFEGPANSQTFLLFWFESKPLNAPQALGISAVGGAPLFVPFGSLSGSGSQLASIPAPALPVGLTPLRVFVQGLCILPAGTALAGDPSVVHIN